ncbi:NOT family protein, putative [Plasmodium malariae]|nr:NOT family protein, putative [Plasmodium malariae]
MKQATQDEKDKAANSDEHEIEGNNNINEKEDNGRGKKNARNEKKSKGVTEENKEKEEHDKNTSEMNRTKHKYYPPLVERDNELCKNSEELPQNGFHSSSNKHLNMLSLGSVVHNYSKNSINNKDSMNNEPFLLNNVKIQYNHNNVDECTMFLLEKMSYENKAFNTEEIIEKKVIGRNSDKEYKENNSEIMKLNVSNMNNDNKVQYCNNHLIDVSVKNENLITMNEGTNNLSTVFNEENKELHNNSIYDSDHLSHSLIFSNESNNDDTSSDYSSSFSLKSYSTCNGKENEIVLQSSFSTDSCSTISNVSTISTISSKYDSIEPELQNEIKRKISDNYKNNVLNNILGLQEVNETNKKYLNKKTYYVMDIFNEDPIKCKYLPSPPVVDEEKGVIIACLFAEWYFIYKNYLNILKMSISNDMQEIIKQQHRLKCVKFFQKLSNLGFLKMDEVSDQFFSHSINISVSIALYNLERDTIVCNELVTGRKMGEQKSDKGIEVEEEGGGKDLKSKKEDKQFNDEQIEISNKVNNFEKKNYEGRKGLEENLGKNGLVEEGQNKQEMEKGGECTPNESDKVQKEEEHSEKEKINNEIVKYKNDVDLKETQSTRELLNYNYIDSWSKMIVTMLTLVHIEQVSPVFLLQKVLNVICRVIHKRCEIERKKFNQRPYFRLLHCLLIDINEGCMHSSDILIHLNCFAKCFALLSPLRTPAFCFSWLELISSKCFMPKLLSNICGWGTYKKLLIALFTFLKFFLKKLQISKAIETLYLGTVRILLVLLHDFPEFLCSYYVTFCSLFPINCIQLRNLVLSAFPRNIKLPDPFMSDVKIDLLQEIKLVPKILTNIVIPLFKNNLKSLIDEYFNKKDFSLLFHIQEKLFLPKNKIYQTFVKYDIDIINSLTLYVGTCICKAKVNNLFKFNNNCDPVLLMKYQEDCLDDVKDILQEIVLTSESNILKKKKNIISLNAGQDKIEKDNNKNADLNLSKKYVELMQENNDEKSKGGGNASSFLYLSTDNSALLKECTNINNDDNSVNNDDDDNNRNNNNDSGSTTTKCNNNEHNISKDNSRIVTIVKNNLAYTLFLFLSKKMDMEGRYLLLSNIVNHIRYPNSHTHYFSCLILFLFSQSNDVLIQEQIIRVLLERILAHRPHPWGLLITFIELIKNAK